MEDDLKKNGRQPQKIKWKTNESTKINLIGCDTIVNSPNISLSMILSPPQAKSLHAGVRFSRSAHLAQSCCDFCITILEIWKGYI